jgi:nucleotide-binding universal stress UspA family protein
VLTAGDEVDPANLLDYLQRYGVAARLDRYEAGGSARARGRARLQRAAAEGADQLVMGAFGEGRMAQFLGLGGATAKVITANTMPLLMAH